jgi:hypothetical protein
MSSNVVVSCLGSLDSSSVLVLAMAEYHHQMLLAKYLGYNQYQVT